MDKNIEVEVLNLSHLSQDDSFVFIYINVGKLPMYKCKAYIESVKEKLTLCQKLEKKKIDYALVACRSNGTKTITMEIKNKNIWEMLLLDFEHGHMKSGSKTITNEMKNEEY